MVTYGHRLATLLGTVGSMYAYTASAVVEVLVMD